MTLRSLWEERQHRSPAPVPPAGALTDGRWDVVVVGGGLAGVTTTLLLARAGVRVLLLEARTLGGGTTGRSTAKLSLLQGTRLSTISRRHGTETVAAYLAGHREGQAWIRRFADEHGVSVESRPAYTFAATKRGTEAVRAELEAAQQVGLPLTWQDSVPLPFATYGAVRLEDQAQVDPLELVTALAREAETHGATVVEGARVHTVHQRDGLEVELDDGSTIATERVVLSTGMPILDRGGFFARMEATRSYAMAFRTAAPTVDGMYLSADSPTRSLRDADGGALLLVGGNGHRTGSNTEHAAKLEDLRRWTHEHFPGSEESHAWSAQDHMSHHRLPYAGPLVPGSDRLYVTGGFAKWGMTGAPAAALAVTAQLLGGQVDWSETWQPWRRSELTGVPTSARFNGTVAVELARGWLVPAVTDRSAPAAVCTHLGGALRWNDAERTWDCPLHGSRFDADGSVLDAPATCGLKRVPVR
ncbi:MAG TPA: FAD-dependent oxidoreductase [Nocardioides sp.]|uniref:FAD-dependent oxidoreductase n=1 Tax=Nocardioides sp. TaxID=35761 RepID=UPI002EDB3631